MILVVQLLLVYILLDFIKRCVNLLFLPDTLFVANCLFDMLFPQQINFLIVVCLMQC